MNEGIKHDNDGSLGFNKYQAKAWMTFCYPPEHMTACLVAGLCSEAGAWKRDERQPVTSSVLKAWEAYRRAVGPDALIRLHGASAWEVAKAGVDALVKAAAGEKGGVEW